MDIISRLLLPPSAEQFGLLAYLIGFMMLVHLPYVGALLISSVISLAYRKTRPALSALFIESLATAGKIVIFGIIPLASLVFLLGQYLYNTSAPVSLYLTRIFILAVPAMILLLVYRRVANVWAGILGSGLLLISSFFLISTLGLVDSPEKWPFILTPLPLVYSIQVIIHFLLFLVASSVFCGAWLLILYFRWPDRRLDTESPDVATMKYWSLSLITFGALLMPVLILWSLYTLPDFAVSGALYVSGGILLLILFILSMLGQSMLRHDHTRFASVTFVIAMLMFGIVVARSHLRQATANQEHLILLGQSVEKTENQLAEAQSARRPQATTSPLELGEKLYNERCTACHRFDRRVVGPPYNDVLPQFMNKKDDLVKFILNPVKVNPDYPSMPNLGLSDREANAVAMFLLTHYQQEKK